MRKLLLIPVVLVVLAIGDVMAKDAAESRIEKAARAELRGVGSVNADIDSFPFTGRLLFTAKVSKLELVLGEVVGHGIGVSRLALEANGIELDRGVLLNSRRVRITDVSSVTITATITEAEVRRATGADVRLLEDRATVTIAGATLPARLTVEDGAIRLSIADLPAVSMPAPDSALLPCEFDARVDDGALVASCTSERLPDIVVDAVGSVELRRE